MEDTDHMASTFSSLRLLVLARNARAILLFLLALLSFTGATAAFAGQFSKLAHAKYMFIGTVTEAKVEAVVKSAIGDAAGSKYPVQNRYVKALVSPQQILTDAPRDPLGNQSVSICAPAISVGATYLFILGDPNTKEGCFYSVPFLLGALPGKSPDSSIILTEDTLFMMPESLDLDQFSIALPDAHVRESFCERNVVVLNTYLDLRVFLDLLKHERTKDRQPE
jgi:hypothetical protein